MERKYNPASRGLKVQAFLPPLVAVRNLAVSSYEHVYSLENWGCSAEKRALTI